MSSASLYAVEGGLGADIDALGAVFETTGEQMRIVYVIVSTDTIIGRCG